MLLAMCSCAAEPVGSAAHDTDPTPTPLQQSGPIASYETIQTITWARVADCALGIRAREYIMLNFGLKVEEKLFSSQNMDDRILQFYSANIAPELATGISVSTVETLARAGMLTELSEHKSELADYFALWDSNAAAWEYTQKNILCNGKSGDKGLYCLVPINRAASKAWIYNKKLFEENSIEFPKTLSELYNILARYKETHKNSDTLWTNQYEPLQFTAILNAYGLTDEVWQTDSASNVFYLYSTREWYDALEWLTKFEKLGVVPTDSTGALTALDSSTYDSITASAGQIIEFTDSYNYLYIQAKQKGDQEWAVAENMICAEEGITPVISANLPYINEAVSIAAAATIQVKNQILFFLNWCCTDAGNMWANFGCEGEGYTVNSDGSFTFLKYYSEELTPNISAEESGRISDITIGRLFTTVPWDSLNIVGYKDRYSAQEEFLANAKLKLVFPTQFTSMASVTEDKTMLWQYANIADKLNTITTDFIEFSRQNGFSDYFWNKYYNSLIEAGLDEYTELMQKRML